MHRLLPFLRWLPDLRQPGILRRDVVAGITVAAIVVPQALAYAALAGLPPIYGLYGALVPPVIAALWGSCRQLVTGPMATASLISAATVGALAARGTDDYIALSLLLALLVGLVRITMGLLRLGVLVDLLSAPVVVGFTNAAALIIASSQLEDVLGVAGEPSAFHVERVASVLLQIPQAHLPTVALSLLTGCALVALRHRSGKILVAVAVSTLAAWLAGYDGAVVGDLDPGLPSLHSPSITWAALPALLAGAVVLTVIGFAETMSIARIIATRTRQHVDANQELIGQGLANLVGSFFGSFAVSGSFARSAVNYSAGAATGFASVVTSAIVLLTLLFLTPVFHFLPQVTLATVIILSVLSLVRVAPIIDAWPVSRADSIVGMATFLVTLSLAPRLHWGIIVGVSLALMQYLRRTMRPHVAYLARHPDGALVDAEAYGLALDQRIAIIRFDGRLFFGASSYFEDKVLDALARLPELRYLILDAGGINSVDATGAQTLRRVVADLRDAGVDVHITRAKGGFVALLRKAGVVDEIGVDHFHDWNQHALEYLWDQMEPAYRARCPLNIATPRERHDVWSI